MEEYKRLLKEYIAFQSVSTEPEKINGILETGNWLISFFKKNGFETKLIIKEGLNPVVFASIIANPKFETVLVYGHYDVQPAKKEDGWNSDPFELVEKNGRLFGRGVVDNKGENLIHIFTVMKLLSEGKLKYNVKFILEGDEETGGVELMAELMEENKDLLKADYVLVSDGEMVAGKPCIEASYRGGFNITVKYNVSKNNVHSGLYGGAVPNAAFELSTLLSKLFTKNNVVAVKDFYKDVDEISPEDLENNSRLAKLGQEDALKNPGFKILKTEGNKYDFFTQTGLRPTLQITGIKSGYIGDGYSNIVPAQAEARINFRIVSSQKPKDVIDAFKFFIEDNTPEYVEYTVDIEGIHDPIKLNINSDFFFKIKEMLSTSYENEVFPYYVGGAIPFIANVKKIWGIDAISIGLCNEDCNMHGANENFKTELVEKGLKFSEKFFTKS